MTNSRKPKVADRNGEIIAEFRANGGKVGGQFQGSDILLLHHTGARSGTERVTPLAFQRVGDSLAVFAAPEGAPGNPAWFYNVRANPVTTIEVGAVELGPVEPGVVDLGPVVTGPEVTGPGETGTGEKGTGEKGTRTVQVQARIAQPTERDVICSRQKERHPDFAEYEVKAAPSKIPVVVLEPLK